MPGAAAPSRPPSRRELAAIAVLALAGQAVIAGLVFASHALLAPEAFAIYATSAALFLLAKTVAPFGMDRLALQVLPAVLRESGAPGVAGFWRIARRRAAIGTGIGMIGMAGIGLVSVDPWTVMLAALGLPIVAAVQLLSVRAILQGRAAWAVFATRLLPGLVVALLLAAYAAGGRAIEVGHLLLAWGVGWSAAAALLCGFGAGSGRTGATAPAGLRTGHATGFVVQSLMLSAMRRAPVIVAGSLAPAGDVATLVLSFALADLAGSLAAQADGPFLRHAAELAAEGRADDRRRLIRRRRRVFASLVALPVGLLVAGTPWIAGGHAQVAGWPDLLVLAAVATGTTALAYSAFPRKLLVRDRDQGWKLRLLAISTCAELALLVALVPATGAMGASLAFAAVAASAAALLARRATRAAAGGV